MTFENKPFQVIYQEEDDQIYYTIRTLKLVNTEVSNFVAKLESIS